MACQNLHLVLVNISDDNLTAIARFAFAICSGISSVMAILTYNHLTDVYVINAPEDPPRLVSIPAADPNRQVRSTDPPLHSSLIVRCRNARHSHLLTHAYAFLCTAFGSTLDCKDAAG